VIAVVTDIGVMVMVLVATPDFDTVNTVADESDDEHVGKIQDVNTSSSNKDHKQQQQAELHLR